MSSIEFRPTNKLKRYHELLNESLVDYCNSIAIFNTKISNKMVSPNI